MNLYKWFFILIFLSLFFSAITLHAQLPGPIILTDEQEQYSVGLYLEILEDPDGVLTFAEVSSGAYDDQFVPSNQNTPNLGISNSTYWFRFRVQNEATKTDTWILEVANANIEDLIVYIHQAGNEEEYQIIETGQIRPFNTRPIAHRNFVFPVTVEPLAETEIYIRAFSIPLSLPLTLWTTDGFIEAIQIDLLRLGITIGILLIMSGYNLFLYFSLRDKSYLYYVLFVGSFLWIVIVRNGFPAQYFQTDFLRSNSLVALILVSMLIVSLLSFTKSFLLTKKYALRLDRLIVVLRIGLIVITLLLSFSPQELLFIFVYFGMIITSIFVVLASSLWVWRRGYQAARFFLLAWFGFLLQLFFSLGISVGLVPPEWLPSRVDFSSIWLVLFLSFALADRIKLLTREKEAAQAELLQQQQEMLRLSDEYTNTLQTTNEQLHHTVLEKEKAQQELKAYAKELERSNNELQDFAYVASHDLQEPLRKIQTFGDRLQVKYANQLDEHGQDYINRMQHAAERLQILIQDLLAFSRVTTRAQPFVLVNLTAVIEEVLQQLEVQIEATSAKITVGALPEIEAEPVQMYQLFQNLISNSLKFHHKDVPPEISITCDLLVEENSCRISVADNGIGFDQEHSERIFVIFQRLHGQNSYTGTGVGLALCKKIVERHGGTIVAQSKPGQGANFTITLPLTQNSKQ